MVETGVVGLLLNNSYKWTIKQIFGKSILKKCKQKNKSQETINTHKLDVKIKQNVKSKYFMHHQLCMALVHHEIISVINKINLIL